MADCPTCPTCSRPHDPAAPDRLCRMAAVLPALAATLGRRAALPATAEDIRARRARKPKIPLGTRPAPAPGRR